MNAATCYDAKTMERMRSVGWEIGQRFAELPPGHYLAFVPIRSGLAYLQWALSKEAVDALHAEEGEAFNGARQTLRLYDVTMLDFDGTNAHSQFDIDVSGLWGRYYWHTDRIERSWMAEAGFRLRDGRYRALARSQSVFMDRAHRSGQTSTRGMYVGGCFDRVISVDNVFDAPVFERIHRSWSGSLAKDLQIAFYAEQPDPENAARMDEYLAKLHEAAVPLGVKFIPGAELGRKKPDLVHAHDVLSVTAAARLADKKKVPLVLTLHTSERERAAMHGEEPDPKALKAEVAALSRADWVVTAHSDTRGRILDEGRLSEERVVVLPDLFQGVVPQAFDPGEIKKRYHLHPGWPMALFSGEISHAAGADLLMAGMEHVCGVNGEAQFVLVGEGPLKGELEHRAHCSGWGNRVRFTGHVGHDAFMDLLTACDFVLIPARTWQDEGLAHLALENGKSVLTTHQARIQSVEHGRNGLVVYDNPGSVIWGLQEMFHHPMGQGGEMARRRHADGPQSLDSLAVELCVLYNTVLKHAKEESNRG